MNKKKIPLLLPYLEYAASEETAYNSEYDPSKGVLHNHCGCIAYVIQTMCGGEQMGARKHIWNRIDGKEYDLTRPDLTPSIRGHKLPDRKTVNHRFKVFYDRVTNKLQEDPIDLS